MKKLIFILLMSFAFSLSAETTKRYELRQLLKDEKITRTSSVGFFFVVGEYKSSETKKLVVKLIAKTELGYEYFEIPFDLIVIKIDNSIRNPYLEFYHEHGNLRRLIVCRFCTKSDKVYLVLPEKYLPEKLVPITL